MQSSCLLRTPVPIPPGISNHRPYTLGCLPAQWGINPHSARNPSTMAYCFPAGSKRVRRLYLILSVTRGGSIFYTCTSLSLAPLGAKGSPLNPATDPLPERKHRQPVSLFGSFSALVVIAHVPGTLGVVFCALAQCTVDCGMPQTLGRSLSTLAWPNLVLH